MPSVISKFLAKLGSHRTFSINAVRLSKYPRKDISWIGATLDSLDIASFWEERVAFDGLFGLINQCHRVEKVSDAIELSVRGWTWYLRFLIGL